MQAGQESTGTGTSEESSPKLCKGVYNPEGCFSSLGQNPSEHRANSTGPGRREALATKILNQLTSKSGLPVSRENLRIQFIRLNSKLIKLLRTGKATRPLYTPGTSPFVQIKQLVLSNIHVFVKVCDIKKVRARFNSFGNDFCCAYFAHEKVRELHRLHVDLIFGAGDPATLCTRTKQYCCRNKPHSPACVETWAAVRTFLQLGMFQELDKVIQAKNPPVPKGIRHEVGEIRPLHSDFGDESKGLVRPEDSELDAGTTLETLYGPEVWEKEGFCFPLVWE